MAAAQRTARSAPSKRARKPSPVVWISRPRKRSSSDRTAVVLGPACRARPHRRAVAAVGGRIDDVGEQDRGQRPLDRGTRPAGERSHRRPSRGVEPRSRRRRPRRRAQAGSRRPRWGRCHSEVPSSRTMRIAPLMSTRMWWYSQCDVPAIGLDDGRPPPARLEDLTCLRPRRRSRISTRPNGNCPHFVRVLEASCCWGAAHPAHGASRRRSAARLPRVTIAHVRERYAPAGAPWRLAAALDAGGRTGAWLDLERARRRAIAADPRLAHNAVALPPAADDARRPPGTRPAGRRAPRARRGFDAASR